VRVLRPSLCLLLCTSFLGCQQDTRGVPARREVGVRATPGWVSGRHPVRGNVSIPAQLVSRRSLCQFPNKRFDILVSTCGAKFSITILKGVCLSREMPSRGHHQVVERVVAQRHSQSRLQDERSVSGRHCRVLGKTGSDNQGSLALSRTEFSRGQAEKQRSWFRVWALQEPVS
jgi:hypothetical protein